jgi:DNA-binding CsgD family transcriptional regulator
MVLEVIGRERETAVLDDLVDGAAERGGALVVRGEAGIGKSTLLATAARRALGRGMVSLTASGVQSEAHLPFAGLHQLLHPLLGHLNELPPPQRAALEAAFGMTDAAAPDLFLIALATLDLLSDAAARSPLLLIAEDAQWLDRPTTDALVFVARRLDVDPIVLLIALREGCDDPFEAAALPELRLGPLDDEAAGAVLDRNLLDLAPAVRARLLREAAGNPLALVELPAALRSDTSQSVLLQQHLSLTTRLERAVAARLQELPEKTRTLLLAAATDGASVLSEVLAAATVVHGSAVTANALGPAVSLRLVGIDGGTIRFQHPLVRSAIYQSASLADRLAVHAALGEVLSDSPDRSVWHRAAATLGPSEGVAAELEATATRAGRRGASVVSVTALERAAELSVGLPDRARRLLRAAELAFELGRRDLAIPLLAKAEPLDLGPLERARMILIRELVDPHPLEGATACRVLIDLAERVRSKGDPELAQDILWLLASRSWWQDPAPDARRDLLAALERVDHAEGGPRVTTALGYAAPEERGAVVIDRLAQAGSGEDLDPETAWMLGAAAIVTGAWDLAPAFLASSVASLRTQARLGQLPRVLVVQAMVAARRADWNLALPAADEARALANETGQRIWAAGADAVGALIAAMRGDEDQAERLAAEAERVVTPLGTAFVLASVQMARGAAALGAGRHLDAFEQLRRLFAVDDPAYHWTMRWWCLADIVEAAVHADRRGAVQPMVDELGVLTQQTPSFWLHTMLRHARALLGDDTRAEELFQLALTADLRRWPFQRARLLLAYGQWLRRRRRTAESRAPLRAAREAFDAVGAATWGERARRELRASGETSRARTPQTREQLTPQELQIAQMVAAGLSNREIGQQLYLSRRTVGSHLYRIFPKLGINSRTQLSGALHRQTGSSL